MAPLLFGAGRKGGRGGRWQREGGGDLGNASVCVCVCRSRVYVKVGVSVLTVVCVGQESM